MLYLYETLYVIAILGLVWSKTRFSMTLPPLSQGDKSGFVGRYQYRWKWNRRATKKTFQNIQVHVDI